MSGTLAVSWGRWGGFYVFRDHGLVWRVCFGWVAVTYCWIELDDLMRAYADGWPDPSIGRGEG